MGARHLVGIAAIRAWPLDELTESAQTTDSSSHRVLRVNAQAEAAAESDPSWVGITHDAAAAAIGAQSTRSKQLARATGEVAGATRTAVAELEPIRARLLALVDTALGEGFAVRDDGVVTHPDEARRTDAAYLDQRIRSLLLRVTDLDHALGHRLATLAELIAGQGALVSRPGGGWASPAAVLAQTESLAPADRRAFVESLQSGELAALRRIDSVAVGNLDGVPFDERIAANAASVRRELADEIAAGRGGEPYAQTLTRLSSATLIAFDPATGHYIEQVGSFAVTPPRTGLPGIGVLVPGTGANLLTSGDNARRARDLSRRSGAPVFVYGDGNFPQDLGEAASPKPALTIGANLVNFGRELDAEVAAQAPGTAVTYLGHSYGGSIVGTAEQFGLRADKIVFASSAGTGAADGPWRDPNPDVHRYSLTPPGDPIHLAQKYGAMSHGGDPDSEAAVTRLDTGYYGHGGGHHGELVAGIPSHSGYLDDPDSVAFDNLVAVLADRPTTEYVERAPDIPAEANTARLLDRLEKRLIPHA